MFHRVLAASLWLVSLASTAVVFTAAAPAADNIRYVSAAGNNANNCKLATPCRSLQRGINRTPVGGELRILDSGDYGANGNIGKSMTISGNGHTVFVANGIVIDNADAVVKLRNLVLDGQGTNVAGISIVAAAAVHIERCVVSNFADDGIVSAASGVEVFVLDTISRDNGGDGLIDQAIGSSSRLTIDNSRFENNGFHGIRVLGGKATISRSTASGNGGSGIVAVGASVNINSTTAAQNIDHGFLASGASRIMIESSVAHGNGGNGLFVFTGGTARISNSTFTDNTTGIDNTGTVETRENNTVRDNSSSDLSGNALTPIGGI